MRLEQLSRLGHMPLLWLVLPLVAGISIARVWQPPGSVGAIAAAGALLLCLGLYGINRCRWQSLAHCRPVDLLALAGGLLLVFWSYADLRTPPRADHSAPPHPREVVVSLKVERLFGGARYGRTHYSGIGRVRDSAELFGHLHGQRIFFSLNAGAFAKTPLAGSHIIAKGVLYGIPDADSRTDFEDFLYRSRCAYRLTQGLLVEVEKPAGWLYRWAYGRNLAFQESLRLGADTPHTRSLSNVAVAMLLGQRGALDPLQQEAFLHTGTMHFFAISGLHVGVVAVALAMGLSLLRLPSGVVAVIGLSLLLLYVLITGAAPSAIRAYLMTAFFWGAWAFQRKPAPASALLASMFTVLLWQPGQLFSAGFQLSYAVAGGILIYGLPLGSWLAVRLDPYRDLPVSLENRQRYIHNALRGLLMTFAVSFSATLFSALLIAEYFGIFTPGAVFLNIILLPLASLAIIAGMLSMLLSLTGWIPLVVLFNHAAWLVLLIMEYLVNAAAHLRYLFWQMPELSAPVGSVGVLLMFLLQLSVIGRQPVSGRRFMVLPLLAAIYLACAWVLD